MEARTVNFSGEQEFFIGLIQFPVSSALLRSVVCNDLIPFVSGRTGDERDHGFGVAHIEYFMWHTWFNKNEIASLVLN